MDTPLAQAVRLLQMSHAELQAFVDAEIAKNPFLCRADEPSEPDLARKVAANWDDDVVVAAAEDGTWDVQLADPDRLRLFVRSASEMPITESDTIDQSELKRDADWLLNCIEQRNRLTLAVVKEVVSQQSAFFTSGPDHMVSLTAAKIAGALNIHESTVSRLGNRLIATPHGRFALKHFFLASHES